MKAVLVFSERPIIMTPMEEELAAVPLDSSAVRHTATPMVAWLARPPRDSLEAPTPMITEVDAQERQRPASLAERKQNSGNKS